MGLFYSFLWFLLRIHSFLGSSADTCATIGVCMSDSARVCVECKEDTDTYRAKRYSVSHIWSVAVSVTCNISPIKA